MYKNGANDKTVCAVFLSKLKYSLIGNNKFERQKKWYSQETLALEAGLSRNAIWKIESGRVSPTIESLEKIAKALEIDFTTLTDVTKVDL